MKKLRGLFATGIMTLSLCGFIIGAKLNEENKLNAAYADSYYTITLNANGGIVPAQGCYSQIYYNPTTQKFYDHLHAKTGEPTGEMAVGATDYNAHWRTGYTFQGYYTAASGGALRCGAQVNTNWNYFGIHQNFVNNKPTGDMTLYARWAAHQHTVNLDKQSGTGGTNSITATYDSAMPSIILPTRAGYNFAGYYDATSGGNKYYNADGTSAKNWDKDPDITISLYARWTAATYTVSFNHQGGTSSLVSKTATYNAAMPALSSSELPTRTAYRFDGYYDAAEGGTKYYNANGSSARSWNKTSNTTLYAHWTLLSFTVSLDQQNGTGGLPSVTATYSQDMPVIGASDLPTREGATFGGYFAQAKGQGKQYYTADGTSANTWDKTSAATIYAYWIPSTDAQYVIDLIDDIGSVTYPDSELKITTARNAYDSLSEALKSIVNDYNYATLVDAEHEFEAQRDSQILAVKNEINALPEITTANFVSDKPLVTTAREHYSALTDEQKELFDADVLASLVAKENTITEMEQEKAAGLAVKDLIAALSDISYPDSKDTLTSTQAAYDALPTTHDNHARSYVDNYSDLEVAWDDYYADRDAQIGDVVTEINGLPEITTANFISDKPLVVTAREHYSALTDEQKELFDADVLASLVAKETAIKTYEDEKAAGEEVKALIDAIGEVSYPGSGSKIQAARDAYDALKNEHERSYVDNLDILTAAEARYEELKVDGVNAVKGLINAIGTVEYTEASKEKIDAARSAYDALTAEQKELVEASVLKVLTDAEAAYAKLEADHEAADNFETLVESIGEVELTPDTKEAIIEARAAYDALTAEQKALVSAQFVTDLINAEKIIDVMERIDAIGEVELTPETKEAIIAARAAYDALTAEQKASVSAQFVTDLINAEKIIDVMERIDNIGEVEYTQECKDKIDDARESYDNLDENLQAEVKNYEVLEAAEQRFIELDILAHKGMPGWGVALLVIGIILLCLGLVALYAFFFLRRFIVLDGEEITSAFLLSNKGEESKLLVIKFRKSWKFVSCKLVNKKHGEVFLKKEYAEAFIAGK